jgi:hypothetical protein
MCNCGSKRNQYHQKVKSNSIDSTANNRALADTYASYEYIGKTALTVFGNRTGFRYRFVGPGAKLNIDHRDITGIEEISVLRKVIRD